MGMKRVCFSVMLCCCVLFVTGCGIRSTGGKVLRKLKEFARTLLLVDETDPDSSRFTFDNYPGFRDWYRFPLQYPYHIVMSDDFSKGRLEKFNGGDIRDPNISSSSVLSGISGIIRKEDCLIFRRIRYEYGVFDYRNGETRFFQSEDELKRSVGAEELPFRSLKESYDDWFRQKSS